MKISDMVLKTTPVGVDYIPIVDPNEPNAANRNKKVLLSSIFGAEGPQGKSAYEVWLDEGNTGTAQDFIDDITGDSGPSAYQSWLNIGNSGTETDFINAIKGPAGTIWYYGNAAPSNALGKNGDYFILTSDGNTYIKSSGNWNTLVLNIKGPAGVSWLAGPDEPVSGQGANGDYYIALISGNVYGPKTGGNWPASIGNLKGPQGIPGSSIITDDGPPSNGIGNDLDYYFDKLNGNWYGPKTSGDWGPIIFELNKTLDQILELGNTSQRPVIIEYDETGDTGHVAHRGRFMEFVHNDANGGSLTRLYGAQDLEGSVVDIILPDHTGMLVTVDDLSNAINALPDPITYKGQWNADTNTPTLADNTGTEGWLYRVSVAGTQDLGSGDIEFSVGDKVVYNGTVWEKWDVTDSVILVNGQTGEVELETTHIPEGTNLYFTDERAQDAVGSILVDSDEIDFVYNDSTPSITATIKTGSIANDKLENNSILIAGNTVELGGEVTADEITGVTTNGIIKRTGSNTYTTATAGSDYAAPTNGTNGQALTSNGAGGFGAPVTLGTAAAENSSAFDPAGSASAAYDAATDYADALIVATITNGDTAHAPSADAVFDALAAKLDADEVGQSVAPLVAGKIPDEYISDTFEDIVLVDEVGDLPGTGAENTLYIVRTGVPPIQNFATYVWDDGQYERLSAYPGTTSDISEGSNLYFTAGRARTAVLTDSITNGDVDHAPTSNAVFDEFAAVYTSLANKANTADLAASAFTDTTDASNITSGILHKNRGGAGDVNGILKANGAGVVSAADAGTDYVIPSQLLTTILLPITDNGSPVAANDTNTFRMPNGVSDLELRASLTVAQATGGLLTIDVMRNGVSILTTPITFDNTSKTTVGATTPYALNTTTLNDNDEITAEVTSIGDGTAEGLKFYLKGIYAP